MKRKSTVVHNNVKIPGLQQRLQNSFHPIAHVDPEWFSDRDLPKPDPGFFVPMTDKNDI